MTSSTEANLLETREKEAAGEEQLPAKKVEKGDCAIATAIAAPSRRSLLLM